MKATAPTTRTYPQFGSSPWPIPYEDFRRFHEAGITGSTARFHDREADRLDALERRGAQQHRTLVVLTVAFCTFALATAIRLAVYVPW